MPLQFSIKLKLKLPSHHTCLTTHKPGNLSSLDKIFMIIVQIKILDIYFVDKVKLYVVLESINFKTFARIKLYNR